MTPTLLTDPAGGKFFLLKNAFAQSIVFSLYVFLKN